MKKYIEIIKTLFWLGIAITTIMTLTAAGAVDKQYESYMRCRGCHDQIYNEWSGSMHSQAITDPIFQGALSQQTDKTICLLCHAPVTRLNGDFDLEQSITNEAITCDFCHTISGLNASNPLSPFILNPGDIKYGTFNNSTSSIHKTQKLDLLTKSEFCAGCHELYFPNGLSVLTTYTEWKDSEYAAKGIQCQTCHMRTIKRSVAIGSPERESHAHTWKGGHSADVVKAAGKFDLDSRIEGSKVIVTAGITNENAGHKFPTGADSRLILEISATDKNGKKIFEDKKTFSKVFGDANGNPVPVPDLATQILSDTRILPKNRSASEFTFDASGIKGDINIKGTLLYRLNIEEFAPGPATKIDELNKIVSMGGLDQEKEPNETKATPGFEGVLALIGLISIYVTRIKRSG